MESAFKRNIQTILVTNFAHGNVVQFFDDAKDCVINSIKYETERVNSIKTYTMLTLLFENTHGESMTLYLYSKNEKLDASSCLHEWYNRCREKLSNRMSEFQNGVSNLALK